MMKVKANRIRTHVTEMTITSAIFNIAQDFYLKELPFSATKSRTMEAIEKASLASWLFAIANTTPRSMKQIGFSNAFDFQSCALAELSSEAKAGGWKWRCNSISNLKKRLTPFHKAGKGEVTFDYAFKSLMTKKTGNKNASKLGHVQQLAILQLFESVSPTSSYKQLHRNYNEYCSKMIESGEWNAQDSMLSLSSFKINLRKILTQTPMNNYKSCVNAANEAMDKAIFIGIRNLSHKSLWQRSIEKQKTTMSAVEVTRNLVQVLKYEEKRLIEEFDDLQSTQKLSGSEIISQVGVDRFQMMFRAKYGTEYKNLSNLQTGGHLKDHSYKLSQDSNPERFKTLKSKYK